MQENKIYIAPLQGFTDYAFRAAFRGLFGTPDAAFSPFIETHKPDSRMYRDVLPEKNQGYRLIPQLLGNEADEMLPVVAELQQMGYDEINLNLGCPYPMVTRKTMGAGLLPHPDRIDRILDGLLNNATCRISVKMRLGFAGNDEWKALLPVLNRYPLSEVIVHGRTASQMYKGDVDVASFAAMAGQLAHPVCFNGNIFSLADFESLADQLPFVSRWMIGRGLIANPLLMQEIRTGQKASDEEIRKALDQLHDQLLYQNSQRLNGNSHVLNKMKPYWEYFAMWLAGKEKGLKKIKKSTTPEAYVMACNAVLKG
ncbi:MAG: tRNA-dihydrouridine synthase family protein [Bacteroidota bacterium]|nr:tRNA-dihydrouridine synthase family protein [Bacteroidota bacterium]